MNHLYYGPRILFRTMIVALLFSFLPQSNALAQSISITAPTSGGTLAPNANFTFQVATGGSVTSVVYWVDNWSWIGQSNSTPFSLTWLNNLSNGSHIIKARANFANGSTLDATDVSFTVGSGGGSGSTSTLTPTDDRDAQSDVTAGTNAVINTSQWNTSFFRFSMTGISGTVSSAKLRLYKGASASSGMSMTIQYTTTDSWTQSGANPGVGSTILTSSVADAAGYIEFDVTGAVQSRMSGTKLISFAVNTNAGGWTTLNAKESGSNKPQLVIITGGGGSSPGGGTNMKIGVNFWNISWEGWADYFQSGVNWSTTTNPWNPALLTDLAPFSGPIRYMDFDNTNGSTIVNWSSRVQKTDNHYSTPSVAYEWMIDLCNRSSKDMWVCVPTYSNSDYWTQLATLIKNNLNSGRKLYLEYSNETWNGGFQQFQYCVSQGQSLGLPGGNQYYQGGAFSVYRSLQIFQAFQQVFGASAMGSRVIRVCSFSGNMDIADQAFANVLSSSTWNPNNQQVDMAAIAPYIGPNDDAGSGVLDGAESNIAARFRANVDWNYTHYIQPAITIANKYGFKLGCYEGGQQLTTNAGAWSANPDIYAEYTYMLDKWKPANFVVFNHYTLYGAYASGGAWGAKADVTKNTANSPKYHALIDWMTNNPAPNTATADSLSATATAEEALAGEAGFGLRIYPNPVSGSLHIDGTGIAKPDVLIRLLNGNGQTLLRRRATAPGGILSTNLDVSQMNSGIYFLQLNSGGKQYIRKVLVK